MERTWVEPKLKHVVTLSRGEEYTLFNPNGLGIGEEGHVYVFDYGNHTVKRFDQDGVYQTTYGEGTGSGPGQMMGMTDSGIYQDSLFYVVDSWQRKVLYFDRARGAFIRSENYKVPLTRLKWASDSIKYVESTGRTSDFLTIDTPGGQQSVSRFLSRDVPPTALDGRLHTHQGRAIYVPHYFPVILTYTPDDTTGIAYATPDYGTVPFPEASVERGGRLIRAPTHVVNAGSVVYNEVISVQRPYTSEDSIEFDLYGAAEVNYLHTVRLPIDRSTSVYSTDVVASIQDTSVVIFSIQSPQK